MLNMREKHSLTATIVRRYHKVGKKEKTQILDEFVETTGYNRSYARRLLNKAKNRDFRRKKKRTVNRKPYYDKTVIKPLTQIYAAMDGICGKRLHSMIPEVARILERDGQLVLNNKVKAKLLKISPATIDRVLQPTRKKSQLKGRSGTKPGTLLKSQIEIRTFAQWDNVKPGFFETDTVAFCGQTLQGHHVWGLNFTDVATGWEGLDAVMGKGQHGIHQATQEFQDRLPFSLLGLDSDNGGEFINDIMFRYCKKQKITFTRIRPGRKNDNCYVEQKNYTTLRRFLGYARYDTPAELELIKQILRLAETYINFFQPSQKLLKKTRDGAKVTRVHDKAQTPYQRLLKSGMLTKSQKQHLYQTYEGLNPMILLQKIRQLQAKLSKLNRYKLVEATIT